MLDGYQRCRQKQVNDMLYHAWHTAYFQRVQEMPKLQSVLVSDGLAKKKQSDEEMMAKARILNALFGGTEVTA